MPAARPLAVILATADLERLYTGFSLLASAAAGGRTALALVTLPALSVLLNDDLAARARAPAATPHVDPRAAGVFARSLSELRAVAGELPSCRLYACAAAVECSGADPAHVARRLHGVRSMPRFLDEAGDAELVVI